MSRGKRFFKPDADSVKEAGESSKKCNVVPKIPKKKLSSSHPTILKPFPKTFPTKMMARKCPPKKKRAKARKAKENAKCKVETDASLLKPKTLEVLLSVHTRTPNFGS